MLWLKSRIDVNGVLMTTQNPLFSGSIVALVTPMDNHGHIDFETLEKLVEFHINSGTDAIVSVGTTGESATLSIDENVRVIEKTVEFAKGRIPIVAGAGANATSEAIVMTKLLRDSGVAGCLSVVPYYNKPTQEGMFQHFKAIAECTDLPQLLYNVPGRTGSDMKPETVARLSQIENIVGIKEATGDLTRITAIKELAGKDFIVLSGDDATGLEAMKLGAEGCFYSPLNFRLFYLSKSGHYFNYFLLKDLRNEKNRTEFSRSSIVIGVFKQRRKNADG